MNDLRPVLSAIKKNQRFIIAAHHNPDADAIASCLAVAVFLKKIGKDVLVVNEDPVPDWLTFLPSSKLFKKAADIKPRAYDAAIVLDCGDIQRIGGVANLLVKDKPLVNIDHHVTNTLFGSVNCIMGVASSTCEIVFELIRAAKVPLSKELAVLLYAGIMTDTGSFRYENTSPRTHAIAAELMAFGINAAVMEHKLYVGIPVQDMKRFTEVIHGARLYMNDSVFCLMLKDKVVKSFSPSFDLKERLFGFLRAIDGIKVVVLLTEVSPQETRVNLRSPGDFDVAKLALKFDGGGHRKAAGAKVYGDLNKAEQDIIGAIGAQMKGKG